MKMQMSWNEFAAQFCALHWQAECCNALRLIEICWISKSTPSSMFCKLSIVIGSSGAAKGLDLAKWSVQINWIHTKNEFYDFKVLALFPKIRSHRLSRVNLSSKMRYRVGLDKLTNDTSSVIMMRTMPTVVLRITTTIMFQCDAPSIRIDRRTNQTKHEIVKM